LGSDPPLIMAKQMYVDIVSAEEQIFSGQADMVIAPGEAGELGIMPEHAPLLTRIKPGTVRIQQGGQDTEVIYVSGGMMEVQPDRVTVLADTSIRAHDLDEAKALEAERQAKEALANRTGALEVAKAQAELAEAAAQLAAIRKLRQRR
jgi:F-type H+-transporting ATPase subunit epsilon